MAVRGGHNLKRILNKALASSGVDSVKVGFFRDAKYPDGTPVAFVAALNEFGHRGGKASGGWGGATPERPFMRQALQKVEPDVVQLVREKVDTEKMVVDDRLAENLGELVAGAIQKSIADGKFKPLSPATLAIRQRPGFRGRATGFLGTKPLNVEGILRTSASYQVERFAL